jgi:hypothetical protein
VQVVLVVVAVALEMVLGLLLLLLFSLVFVTWIGTEMVPLLDGDAEVADEEQEEE